MTGQSRRIRFLLSPRNPIDAEILAWIETLPHSARGTEMLPHLRAALIDYIRKGVSRAGGPEILPEPVPSAWSSRPHSPKQVPAQMPKGSTRTPRNTNVSASSSALAKHLLKDFG
jgi:hypothetical protein